MVATLDNSNNLKLCKHTNAQGKMPCNHLLDSSLIYDLIFRHKNANFECLKCYQPEITTNGDKEVEEAC